MHQIHARVGFRSPGFIWKVVWKDIQMVGSSAVQQLGQFVHYAFINITLRPNACNFYKVGLSSPGCQYCLPSGTQDLGFPHRGRPRPPITAHWLVAWPFLFRVIMGLWPGPNKSLWLAWCQWCRSMVPNDNLDGHQGGHSTVWSFSPFAYYTFII